MTRRTFLGQSVCAAAGFSVAAAGSTLPAAARYSLTAFKYGQSTLAENLVFRGGSKSRRVPISFLFYLVEIGEKKILVDVGCDTMPGFEMEHFIRPADLLRRYGIDPREIAVAVVTHAHHDHIGAVGSFRNAVIVIQKEEALRGAKYLKGLQVRTFDRRLEITPGLEVRTIGGHSAGSSIVLLGHGPRWDVLAGDECYVRACLEKKIPTGASCNPAKSEAFIRTYASAAYDVHLYHDFSILPDRNGRAVIREGWA